MAGIGLEEGLCDKALDSSKKRLECEHGMVLNNPAYTTYHVEMGEISSYPEGYKENAGIFCHNNPWVIIGETVAGRGNDAWSHYTKILPSYVEEKYQTLHKVEPYVNCQMVAGKDAAKPGEGKNSWLTGTAAWMWYTVSEFILGIKPDYEGLLIDPCLPSTAKEIDWEKKNELLASGELDCVMGSFSMTGRENEYRWAGPYLASRQVVAVDPQSDIYTLADLEDKVVAVQSTTKPEDILLNHTNENVPQIKELYCFSDRSYLNPALVEGLVDAIAAHESSLLTYEKDYGVTYRILDEPLLEVGLGTAFDINDTRGIDVKLTRAYQEMLADGTMERLVSKYFDDPSPFLNMEGLS